MALQPTGPHGTFLTRAGFALDMSQGELGALLGVSRRTVSRWVAAGDPLLLPSQAVTLVRALHPRDRALAERVAVQHGLSLEGLGLVANAPSPVPAATPVAHLVDTVVCAAAEVLDASPRAVRPAILAAFERARAVGLTMAAAEDALRASLAPPAPPAPPAKKATAARKA
jgi:hypothetical protein